MLKMRFNLFAIGALAGLAAMAMAAPQPSQAVKNWQLEFDFHDIERVDLILPGDRDPTPFWFMLYTVTNNSGQDVEFYPTFELVTDSLHVITGGDHISPSVYEAIKARYKKIYPFFREPTRVSGKLLQGPDNARTSVAVFRDFDPEASSFTVYAAGLSGEIVRLPNPAYDADKPVSPENPQFFALRKTLAISYDLPGDPRTRAAAHPVRQGREWVMR